MLSKKCLNGNKEVFVFSLDDEFWKLPKGDEDLILGLKDSTDLCGVCPKSTTKTFERSLLIDRPSDERSSCLRGEDPVQKGTWILREVEQETYAIRVENSRVSLL